MISGLRQAISLRSFSSAPRSFGEEEIATMRRFTRNNARTKGFHTKWRFSAPQKR
jgi:hypothetical protein